MVLLASASPQRHDLLRQIGIEPVVIPSDVPEPVDPDDVCGSLKLLASQKASASMAKLIAGSTTQLDGPIWSIGADTVIHHQGRILGKVGNESEASEVLRTLAGTSHSVLTGVSVQRLDLNGSDLESAEQPVVAVARTSVRFRELSTKELAWYVSTGEWRGAAGAYRIQKRGACIVEAIEGSYSNVVGLPIELIYGILCKLGFSFEAG
jgi:septum formation protein